MQNKAPRTFSLYVETITDAEQIGPLDLREEWAADPEGFNVYTATQYDAETTEYLGSTCDLTVLWYIEAGRVGICSNGTADWAYYDDVTAAVEDYINNPDEFEFWN